MLAMPQMIQQWKEVRRFLSHVQLQLVLTNSTEGTRSWMEGMAKAIDGHFACGWNQVSMFVKYCIAAMEAGGAYVYQDV